MVTRKHLGKRIAVLGAGLAGAACARVLARAGYQVTVMESQATCATGASGNPLGIFHPLISKDHNLASQWSVLGMQTTLRWLAELHPSAIAMGIGRLGEVCGVLQLTRDGEHLVHWSAQGGWIHPARFVAACLADATAHGAVVQYGVTVERIHADGRVACADGRSPAFDAVIVCLAQAMERVLPEQALGLNQIRGTVSAFSVPQHASLPCVICADGYATPVIEGQMLVGASYERLPDGPIDPVSNRDRLRTIDVRLAQWCEGLPSVDRTSIRSATIDRMPLVGRLLDTSEILTPRMSQLHQLPRHERLWVLGGLGSRGLTSAPLGAEIIAAQFSGAPMGMSTALINAVDPARFALRRHQRRARF